MTTNQAWISVPTDSDFSLANVPFGVASLAGSVCSAPWCATRIGDTVVNLALLEEAELFDNVLPAKYGAVFNQATLNKFIALPSKYWIITRTRLVDLLSGNDGRLRDNKALQTAAFVAIDKVIMHLPVHIHDYTDFYASREHATNVGTMFRGKDNALQPNWLHLPVGYHGRASTVYCSGRDIARPCGQLQADVSDASKGSVYGPTEKLDFELEVGAIVGGPTNEGPMTLSEAKERVFGYVLLNDWSARDIQKWEYVPLGPFTSKNFATTISPWIISTPALEPFACDTSAGKVQDDPVPLDYLNDPDYHSYDINLTVSIQSQLMDKPKLITQSNLKHLYWTAAQQLVHHSVTGCAMQAGDLLGSGTISGTSSDSYGSMLELTWGGKNKVTLSDSEVRTFLQDGDTVIMRGCSSGNTKSGRVGFGECIGKIVPCMSPSDGTSEDKVSPRCVYTQFTVGNNSVGDWKRTLIDYALRCKGVSYTQTDTTSKEKAALQCKHMETGRIVKLYSLVAIVVFLDEAITHCKQLLPNNTEVESVALDIFEMVCHALQLLTDGEHEGDDRDFLEDQFETIDTSLAQVRGEQQIDGPYIFGRFSPCILDTAIKLLVKKCVEMQVSLTDYPNIR